MSTIIVASNNGEWEADQIGVIGSFNTSKQVNLEEGAIAYLKNIDGDMNPSKFNTSHEAYKKKVREMELSDFVDLSGFVGFHFVSGDYNIVDEIYAFYDTSKM